MYQQDNALLTIHGLTPIRFVLIIFFTLALFESYSLLSIHTVFDNAETSTTTPFLLSALKLALLISGAYFCVKAIGRINARSEYYREHNAMTNLPNRNFFNRHVSEHLAESTIKKQGYAIVVVRLDDYDDLSYTLGHQVTDAIIKKIYQCLHENLSKSDVVCLLTNRSFAIGLKNHGNKQAIERTKELIALFQHGINVEGFNIDINIHAGISYFPDHGETPHLLIKRAAVARFLAAQSHSRVLVYRPDLDPSNRVKLSLMSELLQGIKEDQFKLYVQPKIDIESMKTVQVECLVRWIHPKHGFMNPDDFIPLAEKTGYINDLTLWVLEQAIRQCHSWCQDGHSIKVAVNLSTENLMCEELVEQIPIMVNKYSIDSKMLILEITESAMMKDPKKVIEVTQSLAESGYHFSMDDFGTGYSSLEYIKRLPIGELKIDKAFVQGIDNDKKDEAIVRGATQLAHSMGLKVVAEGVETEQSVETLKAIGCDKLQGYYFTKPLPIDKFNDWLNCSQFGAKAVKAL